MAVRKLRIGEEPMTINVCFDAPKDIDGISIGITEKTDTGTSETIKHINRKMLDKLTDSSEGYAEFIDYEDPNFGYFHIDIVD